MPHSLNASDTSSMLDSKMAAHYPSSTGQVILSLSLMVEAFLHFQKLPQQIPFYLK